MTLRARTKPWLLATSIVAVAITVAGCGGSDASTTAADGSTPTPGASTPGSTVAGGTTTPGATATDPATGQPIATDPNAAGGATGGATATVPDLSGDDVSGGLAGTGSSMFTEKAVGAEEFKELTKPKVDTSLSSDTKTDVPKAVTSYSGAKIYVDGIVHSVSTNGTFPKGNPVFRLLSVTGDDIEIELIAGEFTTGGGVGTVLDKGDLVSLVNASEQLTYRVKYLRPIVDSTGISM